jgi:uncharacterized protein YjlB
MIHHHIYKVPEFLKHKKNLIDLIYKIPKNPLNEEGTKIFHQDYNIPKTMEREYFNYFNNNIFNNFGKSFCNFLNAKSIRLTNLWFQIYKKGNFHDIHSHPGTHFTNVFYINLPNEDLKTKIILPNNELFNISVEEGDILTFPAYYPHKSPINNNDEDKIVIAFNIDSIHGNN